MRLLVAAALLWISLVSIARADVIFPGDEGLPRRRRWPAYEPPVVEQPTNPPAPPPVVVPVVDEEWHPNIEPDLDVPSEEAGFAIALIACVILVLGVREARSERRPA